MRPPNTSSAANTSTATVNEGGFRHWNSPIPYLFGGLALMLGLITVALVILACSIRKPSPAPNSDAATVASTEKKLAAQVNVVVDSDQPKIVVVMAGDDMPTYLAKPVACSTRHDQQSL